MNICSLSEFFKLLLSSACAFTRKDRKLLELFAEVCPI